MISTKTSHFSTAIAVATTTACAFVHSAAQTNSTQVATPALRGSESEQPAPQPEPAAPCGDDKNQTDCEKNTTSCKWVTSDPSQKPFCVEEQKVFIVIDMLDGYDHDFLTGKNGVVVGKEDGSAAKKKQFLSAETPGSVAYLKEPHNFTNVTAVKWSKELDDQVNANMTHPFPADFTNYTHFDSVESLSLDQGWNTGIIGSRLQGASERIVQEIKRKGATNSTNSTSSYYDNVVFVHDFLPGDAAWKSGKAVQTGNLVKQGEYDYLVPYPQFLQITVDSMGKDIIQRIRDLLPEVSIFNEPAVTSPDSPASTPETDQRILNGTVPVFYHRKVVDDAFDTSKASWLTDSPDALGAVDTTDEGLPWKNAQSLEQKLRARGCHPENCALSMSGILTEACVKQSLIHATWLNYHVSLIDEATQSASDDLKNDGITSYTVPKDGIPAGKTKKDFAQPGFYTLVKGPLSEEE